MNKNIFDIGNTVTILKETRIGEVVGLRRWSAGDGDCIHYEWVYWVGFDDDSVEKHEEFDMNKHICRKEDIMKTINIVVHTVTNKSNPTQIMMYDDAQNHYTMTYNNGIMSVDCNSIRLTGDCFGELYGNTCELEDFLYMARENGYDFKIL
jgi:hypothetical protein